MIKKIKIVEEKKCKLEIKKQDDKKYGIPVF